MDSCYRIVIWSIGGMLRQGGLGVDTIKNMTVVQRSQTAEVIVKVRTFLGEAAVIIDPFFEPRNKLSTEIAVRD